MAAGRSTWSVTIRRGREGVNFDLSIDIDLSNGFPIIDCIDWLPQGVRENYRMHEKTFTTPPHQAITATILIIDNGNRLYVYNSIFTEVISHRLP